MKRCLLFLFVLAPLSVSAEVRTWKDSTGKYSVEAEMVDFEDGKVQLRKSDGLVVAVPLAKLSEVDRRYVESQTAKSETEEQGEPMPANSAELEPEPEADEGAAHEAKPIVCKLELKRSAEGRTSRSSAGASANAILSNVSPQRFFSQITAQNADTAPAEFKRLVKQEPKEYQSDSPLRGVARLGSQSFAFAVDMAMPKPDPRGKPAPRARLYFDRNGNGDLTDDPAVLPDGAPTSASPAYFSYRFQPVEMPIEVDGQTVDYAFAFSAYQRSSNDLKYISASLTACAWREGRIALNGRSRRVVLLDSNSNGRFDDAVAVHQSSGGAQARLFPSYGDSLLVESFASGGKSSTGGSLNANRHHVSKLVNLDGVFYSLRVSPAGDNLSLAPASHGLGSVTLPDSGFRAILASDEHGVVGVGGTRSGRVLLPEGEWKLVSYTWSPVGRESRPSRGAPAASSSASISAQGTAACPVIQVRKGAAAAFPFGGPYKAIVTAFPGAADRPASLQMSIVGAAGETCTSLTVNGRSPDKPQLIITSGKNVVQRGTFEWG